MNYLVTGAGMLGTALTARLRDAGHAVTLVDLVAREGVEALDLRDAGAVRGAVRGRDGVFHTAAVHGFREAPTSAFFEANVQGTWNLCEAMVAAGVTRLVHSSTVGVYGDADSFVIGDDTARSAAVSPYNLTKQLAEDVVAWFARARGLQAVALRYGGFVELIEQTYGEVPEGWALSGALVALEDVVTANLRAMELLPLPRAAYVVIPTGGLPGGQYLVDSRTTERDLGFAFAWGWEQLRHLAAVDPDENAR